MGQLQPGYAALGQQYQGQGQQYQKIADQAGNQAANPANNPVNQQYIAAMQAQNNLGLQQNEGALRSRFALGGQTSTAGANPLLNAQANMASQAQTGLNANIAQYLAGQQQNAYQNQLSALSGQQGSMAGQQNALGGQQNVLSGMGSMAQGQMSADSGVQNILSALSNWNMQPEQLFQALAGLTGSSKAGSSGVSGGI